MSREDAIREVLKRLIEYYRPLRIYLIGSTARGEDKPSSDLDFLVVLPDDAPRELLLSGEVYRRLHGVPAAVDVIPIRRAVFEERASWLMSLPAIALREGKLCYEAA